MYILSSSTMAEFSIEQYQDLMQNVNNVSVGSIVNCTSRYGGARDCATVEEFIAELTTYKLMEHLSDADVIKGMPMLLWGEAAEWWSGVKDYVRSFERLVHRVRETFNPQRPAWQIYAEIYAVRQQKSEATESFIRKKRALLAKLPKPLEESDQIDLIFGLLHLRIRERVFRHRVLNFDELVKCAQKAEEAIESSDVKSDDSTKARCSFCHIKGHTAENCFKRAEMESPADPIALAKANEAAATQALNCYGRNVPGFKRSNCPDCNAKPANPFRSEIPIVNIRIYGVRGQAYLDTGVRTSVASLNLKKFFDLYNCPLKQQHAEIAMPDSSSIVQEYSTAECEIELGGKIVDINFVILPHVESNRVLLGTDFMEQAGITLNMGQRYWFFEAQPSDHFHFAKLWPKEMNLLETVLVANRIVSADAEKRKATDSLPNYSKHFQREDHDVSEI